MLADSTSRAAVPPPCCSTVRHFTRQAEVLRSEARWLRNLEHPHMLHCFDVFETRFHMVRQRLLVVGAVRQTCVQLPGPHACLATWVRREEELETGMWVMGICGWSYVLPSESTCTGTWQDHQLQRVHAWSCGQVHSFWTGR